MASELSLTEILSRLESQIAFRRQKEAFHAAQEALHHEQRALHAAELETLTRNLEALKSAATTAIDLATRPAAPPSTATAGPDPDAGRRLTLPRMIERVLETKGPADTFGTNAITAEVNQRYRDRLRRPATARLVSITLRRMLDSGRLRSVRQGKPHHEALYGRG
jgi:hypothetical protein